MRILLAPDTFKGSLTADEAARAMARGAKLFEPTAAIDVAPMSDGGRGFAERMLDAIGGEEVSVAVEDPAGGMIDAPIAWLSDRSAAFDASSFAGKVTGEVVRLAAASGAPCAVIAGRVEAVPGVQAASRALTQTLDPLADPEPAVVEATRRVLERLLE